MSSRHLRSMQTICAASCRHPASPSSTRIEEARSSPSRPSARTQSPSPDPLTDPFPCTLPKAPVPPGLPPSYRRATPTGTSPRRPSGRLRLRAAYSSRSLRPRTPSHAPAALRRGSRPPAARPRIAPFPPRQPARLVAPASGRGLTVCRRPDDRAATQQRCAYALAGGTLAKAPAQPGAPCPRAGPTSLQLPCNPR